MKKLLGIVVLGLLLSVNSYADDDISDLQLNGMSIGDSALDFFSKEIKKRYLSAPKKTPGISTVRIKVNTNT